jgi:hypothetical protein
VLAGRLEIELMAGVARLLKDIGEAKGILTNFSSDTEKIAGAIKTTLGAIGLGAGIGGLVALAHTTVDATAKFKDLGQEAGTTASAISRFDEPARMAGSSTEAVAGAIFKMSKAAIEARDPMSKQAAALTAIGISVKDLKGLGPDEMFERTARQLAKYGDGVEKNAVMQELFGKSGKEMSRVIAEISERRELSARVTNEEAEAADRLQDQMIKLKMNSEDAWRSIVTVGLPAMNAIVKAFIDGKKEAGALQGSVQALAEFFSHAFGSGDGSAGERLAEVNKQIAEIEKINARVANLRGMGLGIFTSDNDVERQAQLNALLKTRAQLEKEVSSDGVIEQNKKAIKGQEQLKLTYDGTAKAVKEVGDAMAHVEAYRQHEIAMAKLANAEAEREMELEDRKLRSIEKTIEGVREYAERLEFETSIMGLSNAEREKAIALHTLEKAGISATAAGVQELVNRIRDQVAAQEQIRQQVSVWTQLADVAGNFFSDLVQHGKGAFDNLRKWIKQLLADMIALFAKRWILQLAGVSGGASYGANSLAGGLIDAGANYLSGGTGGVYGAIGTYVGSYFAGTGATGVIGSAGVGVGTGLAVEGSYGVGAGVAAEGVAGSIAEGIGWTGWGLIIAAAVYAIMRFAGAGGGPKVGGFFSSGGSSDRLFTPNQADSQVRDAVTAGIAGYAAYTRALGATPLSTGPGGALDWRLGFDHDPNGSAQSRVRSEIRDSVGNLIYRGVEDSIDDKAVPGRISLELKRMFLASLQATDISKEVDAIFDSAKDIAHMTSEEIDALIQKGLEMNRVVNGLAALDLKGLDAETLGSFALYGESIGQTFDRIAGAWHSFEDAFLSDDQKLDRAMTSVSSTFEKLGIAVPTSKQAFYDLVKGLDLSTEAGRAMFTTLMNVAPAFAAVEDAAASMMDAFDSLMGDIRPGYTSQMQGLQLSGSVSEFMAGNSWTAGHTQEWVIQQLGTITRDDFSHYDPKWQALILKILGLDHTMKENVDASKEISQALNQNHRDFDDLLTQYSQSKPDRDSPGQVPERPGHRRQQRLGRKAAPGRGRSASTTRCSPPTTAAT